MSIKQKDTDRKNFVKNSGACFKSVMSKHPVI